MTHAFNLSTCEAETAWFTEQATGQPDKRTASPAAAAEKGGGQFHEDSLDVQKNRNWELINIYILRSPSRQTAHSTNNPINAFQLPITLCHQGM